MVDAVVPDTVVVDAVVPGTVAVAVDVVVAVVPATVVVDAVVPDAALTADHPVTGEESTRPQDPPQP